MDFPLTPGLTKKVSLGETLPGTPHHKMSYPSNPVCTVESVAKVMEWFEKKGIKTMVEPEELQIIESNKKKQEISEGRYKSNESSTLLQRRVLKRNLTLKI